MDIFYPGAGGEGGHKIEPSSLPYIFKTAPSAMLSLLYFLDFSFKSYNVSAVKPSYDYRTLQLCQTAARHFEVDGRTGRHKQDKREIVLA